MQDGDAILVMVKDGVVVHYSPNMSLPHVEFVRRTTRELPAGAWVGTVSKLDGELMAITSKHFFGYQLPAPKEVDEAIRKTFDKPGEISRSTSNQALERTAARRMFTFK